MKKSRFRQILYSSLFAVAISAFFFIFGRGIAAAGSGPQPGKMGLDEAGRMQVSDGDRCPVCAMNVIKHPKFASAIQLKESRTFYFCGTGCMIRSWMHPEVFLGVEKDQLEKPVVKAYFTGKEMDAREAIWAAGSDVIGPMGPALVPLKDEAELETFRQRHGAKATFRLSEMDDEKWQAITGKKAVKGK